MRVTLISFSLVLLLLSCAEESEHKHTKKLPNDEDAIAQFNEDGKRVDENLLLPGRKIHFKLRDDEGPTWTCSFFENGISIHSARPKGAYKIKGLTAFVFDAEPVKLVFSKPNIAVGDIFRADSPNAKKTLFFKILKVEALKRPSLPSRKINKSEFKFTKRMAESGDKAAQYNLGIIYANGKGVPQDYKEAVKWYRMSAEQGHDDAQKNLVMMYNFGEGVPQDFKEAVKWWRMLAKKGHAQTQFNLGVIYYRGKGVPQDYEEAYVWFSVARANGNKIAKIPLGILTKKMTKEQIAKAEYLSTEIQNRIEANKKD